MVSDGEFASPSPRSVLIVDDDFLLSRLVAHWLQAAGYHVTQATDGLQALQAIQEAPPDILITDWEMPGLDGLELCRAVRQLSLPHYIYIIVLTGRNEEQLLVSCLDAGADNFLHKPVAREELLARVRSSIRLLQLQAQLQQAALVDPLTKIPSRRVLFEHLYREWHRARREKKALSCVVIDIDFFKRVNDTYGHAAGDEVLRTVAGVLRQQIRGSDCLARLGGEEFCVLLPGTDEEGAATWAERARQAVARASTVIGHTTLFMTASFGVAALAPETASPEELLDHADQALLCAKQAGRDRVVRYSSLVAESVEAGGLGTGEQDPFAGVSAGEVMTPIVVTLSENDSAADAIEMLTRLRTNSIAIVGEEGELVGIVSEKDVMHALASPSIWSRPLRELMRTNVITFDVNTPLRKVYEFLCRVAIRRVVIVDNNKPVGTISRGTLLRWFRTVAIERGLLSDQSAVAAEGAMRNLPTRITHLLQNLAESLIAVGEGLKNVIFGSTDELTARVVATATQLESLSSNLLACSKICAESAGEAFGYDCLEVSAGVSTD